MGRDTEAQRHRDTEVQRHRGAKAPEARRCRGTEEQRGTEKEAQGITGRNTMLCFSVPPCLWASVFEKAATR